MPATLALSNASRTTALRLRPSPGYGILLVTTVGVEYGGLAVLRIVRRRQPAPEFQTAFPRRPRPRGDIRVSR